jgi:hypothetical protein
LRTYIIADTMIAVGYVNVWADHVLVTDLDQSARIKHEIAIEIISVADTNPDALIFGVDRPEPRALGEGIIRTNLDLRAPTYTTAPFDPIAWTQLHTKQTIHQNPNAAGRTSRSRQEQVFQKTLHFLRQRSSQVIAPSGDRRSEALGVTSPWLLYRRAQLAISIVRDSTDRAAGVTQREPFARAFSMLFAIYHMLKPTPHREF